MSVTVGQPERFLYGRSNAAAAIDLSPRAIDYLISSGELEAVRIGRRVMVTAESLKRFAGADHEYVRPKGCRKSQ